MSVREESGWSIATCLLSTCGNNYTVHLGDMLHHSEPHFPEYKYVFISASLFQKLIYLIVFLQRGMVPLLYSRVFQHWSAETNITSHLKLQYVFFYHNYNLSSDACIAATQRQQKHAWHVTLYVPTMWGTRTTWLQCMVYALSRMCKANSSAYKMCKVWNFEAFINNIM